MDFEEIEVKFKHFDVICRFCLKKDKKLIEIIPQSIINFVSVDEEESITEMIELCTGIKISSFDKLPRNVCIECFKELKDCHKFRQKCLKAQDKLENALKLYEVKINSDLENENVNEVFNENIVTCKLESECEKDNERVSKSKVKKYPKIKESGESTNKAKILKKNQIKNKVKPIKSFKQEKKCEKNNKTKKIKGSGQCQFCGKFYISLRGHLRKMHANRFKCNYCNITRPTLKGIEMHMNTHKDCVCDFCGKSYQSKRRLLEHRSMQHTNELNYKCKHCDKSFVLYETYRKHAKTHNPNREEYKCDVCVKKFVSQYALNLHNRIHTGERPYKCEDCGKSFCWNKNYRDHRRVHTKEKPYVCSNCGSSFTQKSSLNVHKKKFHAVP